MRQRASNRGVLLSGQGTQQYQLELLVETTPTRGSTEFFLKKKCLKILFLIFVYDRNLLEIDYSENKK